MTEIPNPIPGVLLTLGHFGESLPDCLSETERERVATYRPPRSEHLAFRRKLVRTVLGATLGVEPQNLEFAVDSNGKPFLVESSSTWFSVSSAGDYALVGVTHQAPIGVDLVAVEPDFDFLPLLDDHFDSTEARPVDARSFFEAWAKKEAEAKALGTGLRGDLMGLGARSHLLELAPCLAGAVCLVP